MKNMIIMNNALKFYKEDELMFSNDLYKEQLSEDINPIAYSDMMKRICNNRFMSGLLSNKF